MPMVHTPWIAIQNDNSPHTSNLDYSVDLAILLSKYYGKNIRQGQTFKLKGVQASLRPANNTYGGIDVGISTQTQFKHIPTTKHSRKAWNHVYQQWRKQKALHSGVGTPIRYDDMEFAWSSGNTTTRTSTIYGNGLSSVGDGNVPEKLCLTGDSTEATDFCIGDFYDTMMTHAPPSKNHFDNVIIKEPKFLDRFPEVQQFVVGSVNATAADMEGVDELFAANVQNDFQTFPTPVSVFSGILQTNTYVMPDDSITQSEDDFEIQFTFWVSSFTPLAYSPRRKSRRKSRYTRSSRRSSGRRGGRRKRRS